MWAARQLGDISVITWCHTFSPATVLAESALI